MATNMLFFSNTHRIKQSKRKRNVAPTNTLQTNLSIRALHVICVHHKYNSPLLISHFHILIFFSAAKSQKGGMLWRARQGAIIMVGHVIVYGCVCVCACECGWAR